MSDRPLTRREESRLLKAGRRVLLNGGFPNPDRVGCPDKSTLRAWADRSLPDEEVLERVDHVGFCSPCYAEYWALRREVVNRRWMRFGAIAAGVVLAVGLSLLAWFGWRQHERDLEAYHLCHLDLRDRGVLRGGGDETPKTPNTPLEMSRRRLDLEIDLVIGSEPGTYEIGVVRGDGKLLVKTSGSAKMENYIAVLRGKIDLRNLPPGPYFLGIGRNDFDWQYFPVVVK